MANENEFPKMLYRSSKIGGATEVWGYEDLYYAIAADADAEKALLADGYRAEVTPTQAAAVATAVPAAS